jgi:hypothetical protein
MSLLRPTLRGSAVLTGLLLLTGSVTVTSAATTASAATPPMARSAAVAAAPSLATTGRSASARRNPYAPLRNYVPYSGSRFSYLKAGKANGSRIRNTVLATIQSTWGGPRDRYGLPLASNGKIRIATWSFGDMGIAKALLAARNRGVSVQVMAAADINKTHPELRWLRKRLGSAYYTRGVAGSQERRSFVRTCPGSCRGRGGTPHAKFFLFDNVGSAHARNIVIQTSMNLTSFAWHGQWNQAEIFSNAQVYAAFMAIYREMRPSTYNSSPYRVYQTGPITNIFFPHPGSGPSTDPVMQMLNQVQCTGATGAGNPGGRTKIRIIQYAIYQSRGEWIAKKLRSLWNAGCDIQIIYSVTTRPVLSILRNHSGRGAIPMKESVIKNGEGQIVKYNHSKWISIAGHIGTSTNAYRTMSGSANWANLALTSDEQMQIVDGYFNARPFMNNFVATWRQRTSGPPTLAYIAEGRVTPLPENNIPWGKGVYKYMSED